VGARRARGVLVVVYEYFLGRCAAAEGKRGGEFFTPPDVVRVLVEVLEPFSGRVYDPCCGSGGMFVQAEKFLERHEADTQAISVYGQELNERTWRMADRKSTRLNSSHVSISYAVFCLKKKKT